MHKTNIPVIASFDSSGRILPLYVRLNNESFKILSCKKRPAKETWLMPDYECRIDNHGYMSYIYLTYDPRDSTWSLVETKK